MEMVQVSVLEPIWFDEINGQLFSGGKHKRLEELFDMFCRYSKLWKTCFGTCTWSRHGGALGLVAACDIVTAEKVPKWLFLK